MFRAVFYIPYTPFTPFTLFFTPFTLFFTRKVSPLSHTFLT